MDRVNTDTRSIIYPHCFSINEIRIMDYEVEVNMNGTKVWIAIILLISLAACNYPGQSAETVFEPEEIGSADEEEIGSIVITLVHSLQAGPTFVKCNTTETIWLQFFKDQPSYVSKFEAVQTNECEVQVFRTGTAGSGTTTTVVPVTFTFTGQFNPAPDCTFTLQIDEAMMLSQITVLHDTLLGDIPVDGLGLDEFTAFPSYTFHFPDEQQIIGSADLFSVTPSDFVIPTFTGCNYSE